MNNEMAVSPIVATLVLIVVAVIGAVAVGTIMGTFSSSVSKQVQTGQAASASETDVLIAGSTTLQVAMQNVSSDYMNANPDVKITVEGGGSGAGISGVANNIIDIGMFSQVMDANQLAAYPTLQQFVVGYGGVVGIANSAETGIKPLGQADWAKMYNTGVLAANAPTDITGLVTRSDVSGTADSFAAYCGITNIYFTGTQTGGTIPITSAKSNSGVVAAVGATGTHLLGFTDLDYASTATNVEIIPWSGYTGTVSANGAATGYTYKDIVAVKNGQADPNQNFPLGAIRPLELLTNGSPNAIAQSIITFTQSPNEATQFHLSNLAHVSDISVS